MSAKVNPIAASLYRLIQRDQVGVGGEGAVIVGDTLIVVWNNVFR
jgi:hypothetical protein